MSQPDEKPETIGASSPGEPPRAEDSSGGDPDETIWSPTPAPPPEPEPEPDPEATIVVAPPVDVSTSDTQVDPEETIVAIPSIQVLPPEVATTQPVVGLADTIFAPTDSMPPSPPRAQGPAETILIGPAGLPTIGLGVTQDDGTLDDGFSLGGFDGLPGQASQAGALSASSFEAGQGGDSPSGVSWGTSKSFWTSSVGLGAGGRSSAGASPGPGSASRPGAGEHRIIAGYEILGELGRGGMGVVYKARQLGLNRVVALKMVLSGVHSGVEQLSRFVAEAQAVAHLQHPNIVQIYEVGNEESGIPFFSLEFVPGGTLSQKLDGKPLADREAATLLETIARAVHYAHENRIVHRDLKPGNILLTPEGSPKIADFGLAKRIDVEASEDGSATRSGAIMGSPSYMAPEQANGDLDQISAATDVYALGSILYELIAGRPPFLAARVLDILEQVRSQDPVPPSRLQPKVSADLETICLKCLQKDPSRRYESAQALADDLRRFLNHEPILARPVSSWEQARRWCRRNPRVAALLGLVLILLTTLAVGGSTLALILARQKAEIEDGRQVALRAWNAAEKNAREAEAARKVADQNAKVAEAQGNAATLTLYGLIRNIQVRIKKEGSQKALRNDLLREALAGLARVVETPSNSPLLTRSRVNGAQQMGDIEYEFGRSEAALAHYIKARDLNEQLWAKDPRNEIAIWNRATLSRKLGEVNLQLKGDIAAARAAFQDAMEGRRTLTTMELKEYKEKKGPTPVQVKNALAEEYFKLSDLARLSGDPAAAWSLDENAVELFKGKAYKTPADYLNTLRKGELPPLRGEPGLIQYVALLSFHLGDRDTARTLLNLAQERATAALKADGSVKARNDLAAVESAQGDLAIQTETPAEALAHYQKAEALYREIVQSEGEAESRLGELGGISYRLATARLASGDSAGALEEYRRCLDLRRQELARDPNHYFRQGNYAVALARCGQHAEAAKLIDTLHARAAREPGLLFLAGAAYAVCAQAEPITPADKAAYRKKAIDTLNEAIRNGYADRVALRTDPDLAGLRTDPEFQSMIK